ncbi:hypothetical protein [Cognataquiflexum aquatile]|uniref:hypothetical protein n=1 Tax=Cognataquiflexum aquatile TaxID=2249427 RepID=UPI001300A1F8|nr:hypothetical protein [Cognataquiflexum aquatile]
MKLKELLDRLNSITKENPQALDMLVVASTDEEGNSFSPLLYSPSLGVYDNGDFVSEKDFEILGMKKSASNALCIN